MKNKYAKRSKISEAKFRQLIKLFVHDLDAQKIASLNNLNRNTINRYLILIRQRIAEFCEKQQPMQGKVEVEVEKPCLGVRGIKGKNDGGAYKKMTVLTICNKDGKVYTEFVSDFNKAWLQDIISKRVAPFSLLYIYGSRYDYDLLGLKFRKHYHVKCGRNGIKRPQIQVNGIESFESYAKRRLNKFYGIAESTFYLHLKECEFRFNNRSQNIHSLLLKMFREKPLF
ncbi:MAG: IS1595 family transposase [Desulfotignum sp.]|nr:IS1595 family transposase [Desulfotignum sp.]MCF8089099.1 IS1595 family transposase [Desulfotignum sp.]MCF8137468.1 IS1595 family transposase [Desulfotignum sp.]